MEIKKMSNREVCNLLASYANRMDRAYEIFRTLDDAIKDHELSALFKDGLNLTDTNQEY